MDGILTKELHGSLSLLSEESMKKLRSYYETGILSLKDQSSLLNELTEQKATLKELDSLN